ncbi:cation/calcium exchanger 2 isoform X2 [Corylus avellana]|uniref:cation/calcium exchanger 2 isoform X2 n=1 Tax=Corylus avellana TaxID=13451 RepID=UPI00286C8A9E|nr:cation/calcium exchanger 2 isoform X2 [Corylus avellana]
MKLFLIDFSAMSAKNNFLLFLNISFLLVGCAFLIIHLYTSECLVLSKFNGLTSSSQQGCKALHTLDDFKAKCSYIKSHDPCVSQGYIDYLYLFYCKIGSFPFLGYSLLSLWLLVLFYLLGNTASEYFCSSLESLSRLLKLSPTIAGVTLLSLGNGAPDIFSTIVSFMGSGTCDVGLNTILGGASFVTCVVVGIISISSRKKQIRVNKSAFIRDVCFFLLVLVFLIVILIQGKIDLWGAIAFTSLYIVYVIMVCTSHYHSKNGGEDGERHGNSGNGSDLTIPILTDMENGEGGFLMSVTWSYITAQELVGLLVSLGYMCGINPSILALTVLAWGNSLGDLTTNLTMAINGGAEGAQVAISGCYAGPIFITLFGLGLSLVGSCWANYPSFVVMPSDPHLLETLGFLAGGLLWALVVLPVRGMRLDGVLGGGLLVVYIVSLFLRLIQTDGSLSLVNMYK